MSDKTKTQDQTFPLFPKLPKEIRLMIWELTLPGPRTVHLRQRKLKTTIGEWEDQSGLSWPLVPEELKYEDENRQVNRSITGRRKIHNSVMRSGIQSALGIPEVPVESSIYREAKLFGLHSQCPPLEAPDVFNLGTVAETWFNPRIDTLYNRLDDFRAYDLWMSEYDIFHPFPVKDEEDWGRVKKLAIYWDVILEPVMGSNDGNWFSIHGYVIKLLKLFSGLEELTIVLKHHEEDSEKGQGQEISFWNPYDLDRVFALMDSLISNPSFQYPREYPWLDMRIEDLEEQFLEMYREEFEDGAEVNLPSVVQAIAVTEGVRKRFLDVTKEQGKVLKEREAALPSVS